MRALLVFLCLSTVIVGCTQSPELKLRLKPEVVELYRLQDVARQSRILNSDDLIAKHEAFFNHPFFCEIAFGIEYINLAEALLVRGKQKKAEKYFLKAARTQYINVSNQLVRIFNRVSNSLEIMFNRPDDVIWDTVFVIPRTPENMKFKKTMLEKILKIEKKQIIDPRIIAIANELGKMFDIDQAVRILDHRNIDVERSLNPLRVHRLDSIMALRLVELNKENLSMREVDSMNIYRIIELIRENPDIDVLRIQREEGAFSPIGTLLWRSLRLNIGFARTAWTDFFEPYFRERAENGRGLDYCYWYDVYRWHIRRDIPYYGVYNPFDIGFFEEDIKKINERRERVGLLPLVQETN